MSKIRILFLAFFTLVVFKSFGQQDPQYTHYNYNMNVLNPAYAGSQGTLSIGLLGRTQWVGIDGAPETLTASIHSPISRNMGVGFSVVSDKIGAISENNVYADFSYTIQTSYEGRLAFGLKGGITFQDINFLRLSKEQENDPLFSENLNENYPNFGAGLFYYTSRFYAGLSMPNILESRHFEKKGGIVSSASERMHYFFTTGYVFDVSQDLKLKPSAMVKAVTGAPVSIDLSATAFLYNKVELGLSWRVDDSVSGLINFLIQPNVRLGYAYDHTYSNLGDFNSGSHEVFLLYDLDLSRRDVNSPRFF
ncbi:type IX secretion system membrane protein, PorP/SprF family [Lutibacter oricola]|uniref:Type IX secretion system membrane protein, PorP/SprF family n=1 Tax=Lutibacter oricola TaxID=762486 RepID=A0A1H3G0P2_9FLAO|nr:type IX secretion system membrane protein PorP/SprF [Lutibacter oricola]SDX96617.1 type IX secretion system membrane protein, PorP/SprF family [Lutibacter oricola]